MTDKRQKRGQKYPESYTGESARNAEGSLLEVDNRLSGSDSSIDNCAATIERVVARTNMSKAYDRVMSNGGSPGVDGITVKQFRSYLKQVWPSIKDQLLLGSYIPSVIRCVEIPKPSGGVRQLGIPTMLDRLIQQALHQVLSPYSKIHSLNIAMALGLVAKHKMQ